ncbi:RapGAP/RanGAP domain-containing protein [Tieghemostelium lacteum]|uniref:RapGAP/RanGAP domain-containing protein n=1 Tax=Tieghemostelium lacteum TaxID=361077 RepID=A0A151Z9U9_TIELA|nr:RapGAP/RanGAP domain-containing protein [Tieghemostelium lacteum]|eukprot:KYQ90706.1 RapGAP/RanGAP domain-containing protein [Tieghemostelium lacteum]
MSTVPTTTSTTTPTTVANSSPLTIGQSSTLSSNISLVTGGAPQEKIKEKEKEKAKKKLAIFFDTNADAFKRFKGLISFIANSDDNDIDKVFKENSYQIYQTMLSTFSAYELGSYKGKQHYAEKEVLKLMQVLKRILIHLEGFVKKGWQVKSIINILEKMLGIENIQSIRMAGFSTLLVFLEVMEKPDKYKLDLFSSTIDFQPFTVDYTSKISFQRKVFSANAEMKRFIVIQSPNQPSKDDATKLFETICLHMDKKLSNFHFWFDLLKSHYLTVLYPTICKQNGLLPTTDTSGFVSHCPHELQYVFINFLCNWITSNPQIKDYFLYNIIPVVPTPTTAQPNNSNNNNNNSSTQTRGSVSSSGSSLSLPNGNTNNFYNPNQTPGQGNISILLEIFRQSCRLPLKYHETIKKSIQTFKILFLDNCNDLELGDELYVYQQFIFNEMLHVFESESQSFEKERETIGQYIIEVYKSMIEVYHQQRSPMKEIILNAMLQGTIALLRKSNPNKALSPTLEQNIVSTTLFGWMKSKEPSKKLWDNFHSQFEEIFYRPEVIKQIRSKLLQMTMVLKELIYPLSARRSAKKLKDIKFNAKGGEPKSLDYQEMPPDIPIDHAIKNIGWEVDDAKWIWTCLLDLFKNLQRIKEPAIYELAIAILVDIVDIYIRTEEEVEFQDYLDKNKPTHLPLFNIFGQRLFDTCQLDSKFIKSKVLAIGCLCRLVCRHHPQYNNSILSHFFGVINNAMVAPPVNGIDLSWSIILNSSNLFNLAIPGANILLPVYLYKIKCILTLKNGDLNPSNDVRKKCIIMICSLIFYPNQYPQMDIYNQREVKGKFLGKDLSMSDLKKDIVEVLQVTLKTDKVVENKIICIWGLSVFLMEEFNCTYNQDLINEIIDTLTGHTLNVDHMVARAALDALASIASIFPKLNKTTINKILLSLCQSILKTLPDMENGTSSISETTMSNHYYCLLEWISIDNSIFDDSTYLEFRSILFHCIEEGLGQKSEIWGNNQIQLGKEQIRELIDVKDIKNTTKNITIRKNLYSMISSKSNNSANIIAQLSEMEQEGIQSSTKLTIVRDACETLLSHCLNFVHNFPSREGPSLFSSNIDEDDDLDFQPSSNVSDDNEKSMRNSGSNSGAQQPIFFVLNDNLIISVMEISKPNSNNGTLARLFIRDATGKYVWNFDCDYDENKIRLLSNSTEGEGHPQHQTTNPKELLDLYLKQTSEQSGGPVIVDQNQNTYQYINHVSKDLQVKPVEKDEKLNNLLAMLSKQYPECLPATGSLLNQPLNNLKSTLLADFTKNQQDVLAFIDKENKQSLSVYSLPPSGTKWSILPPVNEKKPIVSQSCRLLLSYLGLLDFVNFTSIKPLECNHKLSRAMTQLDITPGREILKIGLIYNAQTQDDQKDILKNGEGSELYREFVNGLAWPVDVTTHQGYLGGLDRKKSTGSHAPYYATSTIETIFHDITLMPTNPSDPQQIHKKRHVGNDIVNIIWSEHVRDYSPTTITSQFNDAIIIIYPLDNGLFRVQVYRKEAKVPMFGPLIHGMVINKTLLPLLVRQTAINAYRYVRYNTPNYSKPYVLRKLRIKEIVDRYTSDRNYVDFVHSVTAGYNSSANSYSSITNNTPLSSSIDNSNIQS